jgi:hypothetical protein
MNKDHGDGLKAAAAALKALNPSRYGKPRKPTGILRLLFSARPTSISRRWPWKPISMRED